MTKDEALKMAIEWVEGWKGIAPSKIELLRVLREALAQPAQEPVFPNQRWSKENEMIESWKQPTQEPVLLNVKTHDDKTYKVEVSAPSWQGLSDDEKLAIIRKWKDAHTMREQELIGLGDAIEQALKAKNGQT